MTITKNLVVPSKQKLSGSKSCWKHVLKNKIFFHRGHFGGGVGKNNAFFAQQQ